MYKSKEFTKSTRGKRRKTPVMTLMLQRPLYDKKPDSQIPSCVFLGDPFPFDQMRRELRREWPMFQAMIFVPAIGND